MKPDERQIFFQQLDRKGEKTVREELAIGLHDQVQLRLMEEWLRRQDEVSKSEKERRDRKEQRRRWFIGTFLTVLALVLGSAGTLTDWQKWFGWTRQTDDSANGRKLEALLKSCESDDGAACNDAGRMIGDGEGADVDWEWSATLYLRACELDNAMGCRNAAGRYKKGRGLQRDLGRAEDLYKHACELGLLKACEELDKLYANKRIGAMQIYTPFEDEVASPEYPTLLLTNDRNEDIVIVFEQGGKRYRHEVLIAKSTKEVEFPMRWKCNSLIIEIFTADQLSNRLVWIRDVELDFKCSNEKLNYTLK